ncbi:hypothetical protein [Prevotella sp. E2-28]|uniref:hypothetical protein n=1 Tax=Prevotella sp. E2-28 TaxID=2913620 RepID=UPI001EDA232E|nr:hypothetical protein [Prevotella sp. E2-28]UKK52633.1 hypothetical protein L6465_08445 [Prevotella sp. E2-28]
MENELTIMDAQVEVIQPNQGNSYGALEVLNRSEVDSQIATAKQYPRNLARALNNIETLATMDEETAESCFYALRRGGKLLEGPSVRMAEIVASAYGNLRVQARIIANDGKFITAQGVCHDLETNYAVSAEVKRRITDSKGHTFSEDMQAVTGNAACSIAMRNAVFKVVPMAMFKNVMGKVKQVSIGKSLSLEESRGRMIDYFGKLGVDKQHIFDYLSVDKIDEIDIDMVCELRGLANAIKDGQTTIQETFYPKPVDTANNVEAKPNADLFSGGAQDDKPKTEKKQKI